MARLDVRHRLVHESLACHVHDDRPGGVAFGQREPRRIHQRNRRPPPGVFHDLQCGAQLLGGQDPVAGVGLRADGPLGRDRSALVLHPHLLVVLETARPEDDGAARPDDLRLSISGVAAINNIDAAHDAVLDIEIGERGVQLDRHAHLLQPDAQWRDQCAAHADEVLASQVGPHRTDADLHTAQQPARVALHLVQPHVVLLHHHHVQRHLAIRRLEALFVGPELAGVERLRLDRASSGPSARRLGVVVGVAGHPAHLQWRVLQHERQHLGSALQIGVDLLRGHDIADDRVQVGARRLGGVRHPISLENLVVRDPHAAT